MIEEHHRQLLQKLLDQNLTAEEAAKRLETIIDQEIARPDGQRNQALIDACVDLQWYLATGEHYVSDRENAKARLDERLRAKAGETHKSRVRRMAPRVAAAACCAALLLALPIAGRSILRVERIRGTTVEGGEVYQLNGETVEARALDTAIAEAEVDEEDLSITTTDYGMIAKIQGVDEMHLGYVPEGWKLLYYRYVRTENVTYYTEYYCLENTEKALTYRCTIFPNSASVADGIEQNREGKPLSVGNKCVYFTENYDLSVATWNDELTSYLISGSLTKEEFIQIIESIRGA